MEAKDESLVSTGAFLKMKRCCGATKEEPAEYQLVLKKKNMKNPQISGREERLTTLSQIRKVTKVEEKCESKFRSRGRERERGGSDFGIPALTSVSPERTSSSEIRLCPSLRSSYRSVTCLWACRGCKRDDTQTFSLCTRV